MRNVILLATAAALLLAAAAGAAGQNGNFALESRIAFSSTRDHLDPLLSPPLMGAEVYLTDYVADSERRLVSLVNPPRRLTENESFDGFATLSPDGKKLVFDSTRDTGSLDRSDLFVITMNADGTWGEAVKLVSGGSSAGWSPDSKDIVFHASADGTGTPRLPGLPGSATTDSDLFVANVDDLLAGAAQPVNLTNNGGDYIEDDADWSPDGERIVFVRRDEQPEPEHPEPELYVLNADGSGPLVRLTHNGEEERGPTWSPDGTNVAYSCRTGGARAELCVIDADGSGVQQLTKNDCPDLTPTWSPDGEQILFHRNVPCTLPGGGQRPQQLWVMNAPTDADDCPYATPSCNFEAIQLTFPPLEGINNIANWGVLRVKAEG